MITREQRFAMGAYERISGRSGGTGGKNEYASISKSFPALVHSSGLCQALGFAEAKSQKDSLKPYKQYLDDLAAVMGMDAEVLLDSSRDAEIATYQRLTRDAMSAAGWLARYAEAILEEKGD